MPSLKKLWAKLTTKKPTETALIHRVVGFVIGMLMIAAVTVMKISPGFSNGYRTLELKSLDFRFKLRPKITEHPKIVNIDLDDSLSNLKLPFPLPRTEYARVIKMLHRLGAKSITMDVMFKDPAKPTAEDDLLSRFMKHDENLASAIAEAGNVFLAWSFSNDPLLPPKSKDLYEKIKAVVLKDLRVDAATAAKAIGAEQEAIGGKFEQMRRRILKEYLIEEIQKQPVGAGELKAEDVLKSLVPAYDPALNESEAILVRETLQDAYSLAAIDQHSSWPCPPEAGHPTLSIYEIPPPRRVFNAGIVRDNKPIPGARGAGFANDFKDSEDGTLRHSLPVNVWRGRAYYHLAFRTICDALGVKPDRIRANPRQSIELRVNSAEFPSLPETLVAPLNEKNEVLINWAGGGPPDPPFVHIPLAALLELDTCTLFIGTNAGAAFGVMWEIVPQLGPAIPALNQKVPPAILTLLAAEAETGQANQSKDAFAEMERRRQLRDQAEWMIASVRQWSKAIAAWIPNAVKNNDIDAQVAGELNARMQTAEAIIANNVLPNIEREKFILHEIQDKVKGAYCIVGSGGTGSGDLHPTPLYPNFPGPWVLSNILNMYFTNQFLYDTSAALNIAAITLCGFLISILVMYTGPVTSTVGTLGAELLWFGFAQYLFNARSLLIDVTGPVIVIFLCFAFITAYRQLIEGRDKRQVRKMFGLFVSDQVLSELMKNPDAINLGGTKRVATIFFSDVSGFTALSEKMDPTDQIRFMNEYLTAMSDVIMKHNGYLDKYIGDGIMAVYGAPLQTETHAVDAARTALGCLVELKKLNEKLTVEGKPNIKIRIGISTGEVVAGLVGSSKKISYTAMGDFVNLGARLEAASKQYKTKILMNDRCYERCKKDVVARELDLIRVPGKSIPVQVFELLGLEGDGHADKDGFLPLYNAGLALYKQRKWEDAAKLFDQVLALNPEDGPSKIYSERATLFMDVPPPDDWDGVAVVSVK